MEGGCDWNGSVENVVERNCGFDRCSEASRECEERAASLAGSRSRIDISRETQVPKIEKTIANQWVSPFNKKGDAKSAAIISELNNYHRYASNSVGCIAKRDAKNRVTPPSGALKSPWEDELGKVSSLIASGKKHPKDPPPLLLSGSNLSLTCTDARPPVTIKARVRPIRSSPPKKGVPHVYHDYSNVPDTVGIVRKKTGGVTQPFPEKLHTMLDNDDDPSIVGWLPHGRAFLVRNPAEFTSKIMPKYFRQTKLTSFQRQLNLYGFRRLTQGADSGAYYHELFLRGRPQLCLRMQRQKIKGTGHKQPADVQTEPNFYAMAPSEKCVEANDTKHTTTKVRTVSNSGSYTSRTITFRHDAFAELSPGSRGVHGAACLLNGMKTKGFNTINQPSRTSGSFLNQSKGCNRTMVDETHWKQTNRSSSPASSLSTTQSSTQAPSPVPPSSYDFFVLNQRSMSLLGRVQKFSRPPIKGPVASQVIDSSALTSWPPDRKSTIESPSQTTATYESTIASIPSPSHPYLPHDYEGTKQQTKIHHTIKMKPHQPMSSKLIGNKMQAKLSQSQNLKLLS